MAALLNARLRLDQGRPRRASRHRLDLHARRADDDRTRRLADVVFLTPDGAPFYGGTYFPPRGPLRVARRSPMCCTRIAEASVGAGRDGRSMRASALAECADRGPRRRTPGFSARAARLRDAGGSPIASSRATIDRETGAWAARRSSRNRWSLEFLMQVATCDGARPDARTMLAMPRRPRHARRDGVRRHLRPDRRRLPPLFDRRALARAALREDALRQRAARTRLPARLAGHRRRALRRIATETLDYVAARDARPRAAASTRLRTRTPRARRARFYVWTPEQIRQGDPGCFARRRGCCGGRREPLHDGVRGHRGWQLRG